MSEDQISSDAHAVDVALRIPNVSAPDRDALFRLLVEEIKDLTESEKLQGWTPWVMSASLISVSWIVVQDIWANRVSFQASLGPFLIVALGLTSFLHIIGIARDLSERERSKFFLIHATNTPLHAVVLTAWLSCLAFVCFIFKPIPPPYLLRIVGVTFAIFALFSAVTVIAIAARLPLPINKKGSRTALFTGVALVALYSYAVVILLRANVVRVATVSDLRTGGLLALSGFALLIVSRGRGHHEVVRRTLMELRRDLILDSIPLDEARQRARMALRGMWISDVVKDDVRLLLGHISAVRSLYDEAFRKIDVLKGAVDIGTVAVPLKEFEKDAVSNTLEVLHSFEMRILKISEEYFRLLKNVQQRIEVVARIAGETATDRDALLLETRRAQAQADSDLLRFAREYHAIQAAWNSWFPSESKQYTPFGVAAEDAS